uniref:Retrotransposon gag domain-containing protein n=1 Tax=Phytophthora ramorum TaxID=164328 RepID=H3HAJ9_PHYRM
MENEQKEFLARERLEAMERERRRDQRDLDARRHVQELTDRLVRAETARLEAERRAQDLEARQTQDERRAQESAQDAARADVLEQERLGAAYAERMQAEIDAERARWDEGAQREQMSEMESLRQKVQDAEAALGQEPAQLLATVQRPFPQNQEKHVKRDNGAEDAAAAQSVQATQGATTRTSVSRAHSASRTQGTSRAQGASSAEQTPHSGSRRSDDKRKPPKKEKRQDASPPADPDPSGDSSSEDSSSSESDYDFGQDADSNLTAAKTPEGTTLLTFRPYINSHTLSEFDTKAAIRERVHWWEQFANLAAQGAWSNKMRIQELKLKLSGAARDWFNQLPKHTQRDWKELATAFRKKYCKARASYSE